MSMVIMMRDMMGLLYKRFRRISEDRSEATLPPSEEPVLPRGGDLPEPVPSRAIDLHRTLLYVYRLRALLRLQWPVGTEEILEEMGWQHAMRFFGFKNDDYPADRVEDLDAWLECLLEAHDARAMEFVRQGRIPGDFRTLDTLLDALGLTSPDHEAVVRYVCVVMGDEETRRFLSERTEGGAAGEHVEVMTSLTGRAPTPIRKAVRQLADAGVLILRGGRFYTVLDDEGIVLTRSLRHLLEEEITDRESLIRHLCPSVAFDDSVDLEDFPHLSRQLDLARRMLIGSSRKGRACHLLLVGPPGTGKTSCAFALSRAVESLPVPVRVEDREGDDLPSHQRLSDYRLKQALFRRNRENTLIVFDEVEDIFGSGLSFLGGQLGSRSEKARLTSLMDSARVPTVWITNSHEGWDPAYLRRFSLVIRVSVPPREVRRAQVRKLCQPLGVSEGFIDRITDRRLPVAIVTQAIRAIGASGASEEAVERDLQTVLDGYLQSVGDLPIMGRRNFPLPSFDRRFLNLSVKVGHLYSAMKRGEPLRLLFEGPPGTGKSELAARLAAHAGKDLVELRASDLLSKFVGDTEKRIAAWFTYAATVDTVLLIDEADSFLRSRAGAGGRWEISVVNELLVRIEAHPGVVILGTNFAEALDEALIRRMDFKVSFRPLDRSQRVEVFKAVLAHNGCRVETLPEEIVTALGQMDRLTIGDFRPAVRRLILMEEPVTPRTLLRELQEEYRVRCPGRPIGFVGGG